jgi:hypothetical protein
MALLLIPASVDELDNFRGNDFEPAWDLKMD